MKKNLSNSIKESLKDEYDIEQVFDDKEACLEIGKMVEWD